MADWKELLAMFWGQIEMGFRQCFEMADWKELLVIFSSRLKGAFGNVLRLQINWSLRQCFEVADWKELLAMFWGQIERSFRQCLGVVDWNGLSAMFWGCRLTGAWCNVLRWRIERSFWQCFEGRLKWAFGNVLRADWKELLATFGNGRSNQRVFRNTYILL